MRMLSQTVINEQVLLGMEKNSPQSLDPLSRHLPAFLHGPARKFGDLGGVIQGSRLPRSLQSSYRTYSFVKD
jgi:hypothetical protein